MNKRHRKRTLNALFPKETLKKESVQRLSQAQKGEIDHTIEIAQYRRDLNVQYAMYALKSLLSTLEHNKDFVSTGLSLIEHDKFDILEFGKDVFRGQKDMSWA